MPRHMVDFNNMTLEGWNALCGLASNIANNPEEYRDACAGKIIATLFYEPSTRTQFSFQSAMMKLGGNVLGFSGADSSSVSKGESLADTVRVVAGYADAVVIRHPMEGAAYAASLYCPVPVINAGDGGHLHPTQTMTDLFTIKSLRGSCENLTVGVCGDLLNGRTVHSLLKAFTMFSGNTFYLISTSELSLPAHYVEELERTGNKVISCVRIEDCIKFLDIIYMTRIQRERFISADEYRKQVGIYVLDKEKLSEARKDLMILHPLPRVGEIAAEVDDDPRAQYFRQAQCGVYIRMALLMSLLRNGNEIPEAAEDKAGAACENPKCITAHEKYLPHRSAFGNCAYCGRANA